MSGSGDQQLDPTSAQIHVWVDCDTGHDDAFALLLAAYHPNTVLVGVSTVFGNAPLPRTTHNTCAVLDAIGKSTIPVIRGAARPLKREPRYATGFHGESGLDGVTVLPAPTLSQLLTPPDPSSAIAAAILALPPHTLRLIATGPLTNIAALLTAHPAIAAHIASLTIMGGAVGAPFTNPPWPADPSRIGNWGRWAEFNLICDPDAAALVLSHPVLAPKTTLATLDLTHAVRCTAPLSARLFPAESPSRTRRLFAEINAFFAGANARHHALADGPPMHDPVAAALALFPARPFADGVKEGFVVPADAGERFEVEVVREGVQVGRTVVRGLEEGVEGVAVPRALDLEVFWDAVEAALGAAERAVEG